jgi:hypothetical protein
MLSAAGFFASVSADISRWIILVRWTYESSMPVA